MLSKKTGNLLVIISAIAFGWLAIFTKYAYQSNHSTFSILAIRFTIAAMLLWIAVFVKKEDVRLDSKNLLTVFLLGATGYGLMSTCFFTAVKMIPASIASLILYTYPIIVTVISAIVDKDRITWKKGIALAVCSLGLVLTVGIAFENVQPAGLLYAFAAAVVYSIYIIAGNKFIKTISPLVTTTYVSTAAAVAFFIVGSLTGGIIVSMDAKGWLAVLGIALISTVVAILTFFEGMKAVGPSEASIVSTLEPVVTVVLSLILFGEKLTGLQVIGGVMILTAVILVSGGKTAEKEGDTKNS